MFGIGGNFMARGIKMPESVNKTCPKIGDLFPEMIVQTTQGEIHLPQDYQGNWFVFFSHPGDFTPVCTTEYIAFQNLSAEFEKLNTKLIGLSVDQVYAHLKWVEWIEGNLGVKITFPVIADPMGRISAVLCMIRAGEDSRTVRSVFIVDDQGIIRLILTYPSEVGRNFPEILRALQALQTADQNKAATPANWPNNELIGDNLIVPPAGTVEQIDLRKKQAQAGEIYCYDWWFCYKPLES
jgi:peroxiredoxin (alkyl hydroperoxide reductase subunit C)